MALMVHVPSKRNGENCVPIFKTDADAAAHVKREGINYPTTEQAREAIRRMTIR